MTLRLIVKGFTAAAIILAAITTAMPSHAAELPTCDDPEVQRILLGATRAIKINTLPRDLRSNTPAMRWCSATLHMAPSQPSIGWWYEQMTYTIEFFNANEGRYWVQVRSGRRCEFAQNESEKMLIEDMFGRGVTCR
jgi:hypothetical protein